MKGKTLNTTVSEFKIGDKVLDMSNIEGTVIDSKNHPAQIRVSFDGKGGNWRDLNPKYLRHVTVSESKQVKEGLVEIGGSFVTPSYLKHILNCHDDMLEALKELISEFSNYDIQKETGIVITKAEAAIAKATNNQ